jgi:hypothetical protein
MTEDIFDRVQRFCDMNHLVDVADKVPIFICSIGAHMFNSVNKCHMCDFDPLTADEGAFVIDNCPLRHSDYPIYMPASRLTDTRIHILMRGAKGSGKNVLLDLFCAEHTGLLWNSKADEGEGFRTMIGANSITEAGMFGSVNDEGQIMGNPIARHMCGGFLCFEEFSSMSDASRKDHSVDMKNQLLTSLDSGRVNKSMRSGWVRYNTRYTMWAGTQPARFELESGLDRRFFIIDIEMSPEKELEYKKAQNAQASISAEERAKLIEEGIEMRKWFIERQKKVFANKPQGLSFSEEFEQWVLQESVRSFESDLFRRLAIGYTMMKGDWVDKELLIIELDDRLKQILESSLAMRRNVMDEDIRLIRTTFWEKDIPRSTLLKEVAKLITGNDYTSAKRWIEEYLVGQAWFKEFTPKKIGRGRKGVMCRFGFDEVRAHEKE